MDRAVDPSGLTNPYVRSPNTAGGPDQTESGADPLDVDPMDLYSPPMEQLDQPWLDYLALLKQVGEVFNRVKSEFTRETVCRRGCDDCCSAPFRLQLIEALTVRMAVDALPREERRPILHRARKTADKAAALFDNLPLDPARASREVSRARLRCPLLTDQGCAVYPSRPITCRLYGLPTASAGVGHTCPKSGFHVGQSYPTVDLDAIFDRLADMSLELVRLSGASSLIMAPYTVGAALAADFPDQLRPDKALGPKRRPAKAGRDNS